MEFTISRRVRRRGLGLVAAGIAGVAATVAWLAWAGAPDSPGGPLTAFGFCALALLAGARELARLRKPFRLYVDAFGLTLHDAELSWAQIDAVALRYRPTSDENPAPAPPRLILWTAAGVVLPRAFEYGEDGRPCYTLLDTQDLDQPLAALAGALAAHAGAAFETAPRDLRSPTPLTVRGPEHRVPGGERVFRAGEGLGAWLLFWVAVAALCLVPFVVLFGTGRLPGPEKYSGLWVLAALGSWWAAVRTFRRWRRPLRLRIGPDGIGAREYADAEFLIGWPHIAAVTIGPRPDSADLRPWLIVWPVPGIAPVAPAVVLVGGHQAYPLVRLDRLPGGDPEIAPAVRAFAGERFSGGQKQFP